MDPIAVGVFGTLLLVAPLLMGTPIAFMMMLVGFLGIWKLSALPAALPTVAQTLYGVTSHYPYTIIPLFILMGSFAHPYGQLCPEPGVVSRASAIVAGTREPSAPSSAVAIKRNHLRIEDVAPRCERDLAEQGVEGESRRPRQQHTDRRQREHEAEDQRR